MRRQRRKFTPEFKLQVILEVLKERATLSELAQKYELHPNQITKWKLDFLENATSILTHKNSKKESSHKQDIEQLYSTIGRLKMENDFLKKKLC